ncbi:MAG: serine--tRNA ligase [Oscillospiraceae bacterium]|nr:serine--tRNA ligase [Oscillospiraceae bacterium]
MIDIRLIRSNPDEVKKSVGRRGKNYDELFDKILEIDENRRKISSKCDELKCEQNLFSKQLPELKKSGQDISEMMKKMKEISEEVKTLSQKVLDLETSQQSLLLQIPNLVHESTPDGKSDSDNVEIRKFSEPRKFDFSPLPHWDLGKSLDIIDSERAAKVTGTRFVFYKGLGARLERAVINFYLDIHSKNGYTELFPPFIANRDSLIGTGQLPKFEEDMFKLENKDYYLISTAEVPVTNFHRAEILNASDLPIKYCAYSGCFRGEAGSAGRDTRGLIRLHQFNKVELVKFVEPEKSYQELELLVEDAQRVLKLLELPHRVVALSAGDLGFCSAKTYDIEVWMPSYDRYVEISSCSNFQDYQARRANIKYKNNAKDKAQFLHTLNGSGVAVGRTVAAILENYQNKDGSVTIPKVLVPYMGCDVI